jgi:Zn-finger nucleic acid-binding protein
MKCPACQIEMLREMHQGIELLSCPTCEGVWLERTELEKIMENTRMKVEPVHNFFQHEKHHHVNEGHYLGHQSRKYRRNNPDDLSD